MFYFKQNIFWDWNEKKVQVQTMIFNDEIENQEDDNVDHGEVSQHVSPNYMKMIL